MRKIDELELIEVFRCCIVVDIHTFVQYDSPTFSKRNENRLENGIDSHCENCGQKISEKNTEEEDLFYIGYGLCPECFSRGRVTKIIFQSDTKGNCIHKGGILYDYYQFSKHVFLFNKEAKNE